MEEEKGKTHEPERAMRMSKKSVLISLGFMLLNIAVVVVIAALEFGKKAERPSFADLSALLSRDDNYIFLLCAIGLTVLSILFDALKNTIAVRAATKRTRFGVGYKCSAIGRYYDYVTPLSVGGQPFQVHYLTQKNLPVHQALGAILAVFVLQQISFMLLSPYFLIRGMLLTDTTVIVKVFMWIGYGFFAAIPTMVVLMTFKPSIAMSVVNFFLRILKKLHILKNPDKLSRRITKNLNRYRHTIRSFGEHKGSMILIFILSVLQYFFYFGIPYFICRALGASAEGTVNIFAQMIMIFFAITIVPTPGNSIAAEFSFYAVFLNALGSMVFFGVLLWRLLVFYAYLLQGLIVIVVRSVNNAVKAKRYKTQPETPAGNAAASETADGQAMDTDTAAAARAETDADGQTADAGTNANAGANDTAETDV
ncbi:hypothetical protein FACS1894211_16110 [Clostridia bacterium]|nr:hypothetical protein FACS1894211_16110 [Clostridia bacterium]